MLTRAQKTDLLIIIAVLTGIAAVIVWLLSMGSVGLPLAGEACKHDNCAGSSGSTLGKAIAAALATISIVTVLALFARRGGEPKPPRLS